MGRAQQGHTSKSRLGKCGLAKDEHAGTKHQAILGGGWFCSPGCKAPHSLIHT